MDTQLIIPKGKKVYFASDFHLGFPNLEESIFREKELVKWLDLIKIDAHALFLVGDLFDFWFEYRQTIPKGFVRFIGKLAELSDRGIEIHIFVGNHDLWMRDYFQTELSAKIYREPCQMDLIFDEVSHLIYIGHGDGVGPGDYGYKFLKKIFTNPIAQFCFRLLHPDLGIKLAHYWSNTRKSNAIKDGVVAFDENTDFILAYVKTILKSHSENVRPIQSFIFGHRHHPIAFPLNGNATYYNLGDWFSPNFKNAYSLSISEYETKFQVYHKS